MTTSTSRPRRLRVLDSGPGEPAFNMAADEVLLRGADSRPTLRFYSWDPPAVSLGYFQPFAAAPALDLPLVRRLTGGGALLHGAELTYSIAAPISLLGAGLKESYARSLGAVRAALARVGVDCDPLEDAGTGGGGSRDETFFCDARRSPYDLRHRGRKLVGSAQRREGRRVLQHGSIPLERAAGAGTTSVAEAAGRRVDYADLRDALAAAFTSHLDLEAEPAPLDDDERAAVREIAALRYGNDGWTRLR